MGKAFIAVVMSAMLMVLTGACAGTYYGAMEKVGIHKRDILIDRVEAARDSQDDAGKQFTSALEQFGAVVQLKDTDLKKAYEKLNAEYEDSEEAAREVSYRIDKVESVAGALFEEWEDELNLYQNAELQRISRQKLKETKSRYQKMLAGMKRAEQSMDPVLKTFRDNVLFLKHNLNAQAIGSLQSEFSALKGRIDGLLKQMNESIESSNTFITELKK